MTRADAGNGTDDDLALLAEEEAPTGRSTVGQRAYRAVKQAIVRARLRPGQPISEAELARRLGVSRQPVREAFIKLAEAGLVEIRPQRGTFVQLISLSEVENARFIREALEVAVVRRAAERAAPADIAALEEILERQVAAGRARDQDLFLALDDRLHRTIAAIAGCENAWRVVEEQKAQMDRVRFMSLANATPVETIVAQHREIVAAIATGSPDAAEAAMRRHLSEILISLPRIAEDHPDMFVP